MPELQRKGTVNITYLMGHDLLPCAQYLGTLLRYPLNIQLKNEVNYNCPYKSKARSFKVTLKKCKNTQVSRMGENIILPKEKNCIYSKFGKYVRGQKGKQRKRELTEVRNVYQPGTH